MDLNQRKEQFSSAYVKAVASVAGFALYKPDVDDDSVDCGIAARGRQGTVRSPRLELQLKCTESNMVRGDVIKFPLKRKNYEDLRDEHVMVPRILVVVMVPSALNDWIAQSPEGLLLRHCGYWVSLRGMAETDNTTAVTVDVPLTNQFSVDSLCGVMTRLGRENLP